MMRATSSSTSVSRAPIDPLVVVVVFLVVTAAGALALGYPQLAALKVAVGLGGGATWWTLRRRELVRERRQVEALLQQKSVLEEQTARLQAQAAELSLARDDALSAKKARDAFLATMSHELRTPLNAVIGAAGLLSDTPLGEQEREYVDLIAASGRTLLDLIGDILDISKLEAGRLEPEERAFDLQTCLDDALDLVAAQAHAREIELVADVSAEVPARLVSDVGRLRQVLVNLLSNAVKFTRRGEVVLRVRARERGDGKCEVQFDVRDTGIGIPKERHDRLFLPFSQVDSSTTREFGGTGLGLAISHALVGLMGGRMWVESEVNCGSTFSFTIVAPAEREVPSALAQGMRVLIVDDNATARAALGGMMRSLGAETTEVGTAREALAALARSPFDRVLLDTSVVSEDGQPLGLELRRRFSTTRLLLLAARSTRERSALLSLGEGVSYIAKPVRRAALLVQLKATRPSLPEMRERSVSNVTLRILLVEDNPVNRRVMMKMLEKLGHRAEHASDGRQALEMIARQRFQVVLLDVNMPGLDGYEVAAQIVRDYPHSRRPRIVGVTANALPGDREKCLAAGMNDYLSKPVELDALAQVLQGASLASEFRWSTTSTLLNPIIVQQIRNGPGGEEQLHQLCSEFLGEGGARLAGLRAAIERRELSVGGREAKALLRLAQSLGATQLAAVLIGVDLLLSTQRVAELPEAIEQLAGMFERTSQAVRRLDQSLGREAARP